MGNACTLIIEDLGKATRNASARWAPFKVELDSKK